ncbi:MAG: sensor histidine kinase [Bacteroidetes bacterium]|nr:sensor histidine kinase [Bacteroidota bacterium]
MESTLHSRSDQRFYYTLSSYLQEALEEERKAISREIHDELGQMLTTIKIHLSLLPEEIRTDVTAALQRTDEIMKQVDLAIRTVKNIITKLRPGLLDDLGLIAAIEWQASEFQRQTGIVCDVTVPPIEIQLPQDLATAIFRILQEALTNVSRHACATRVAIAFNISNDTYTLRVKDNGRGITEEEIKHPRSFGLIGIRERAQQWGGTFSIIGYPNKGTEVLITIPRYEMNV